MVVGAPFAEVDGRRAGSAYALTVGTPRDREAHGLGTDVPLDATTRDELARPHRTVAQDFQIRTAGAVIMAFGVASIVAGAIVTVAGVYSNRTCTTGSFDFFPRCTYRADDTLLGGGIGTIALGAALVVTGVVIFAQRQQGPLSPRIALVPTDGGALGSMSLVF